MGAMPSTSPFFGRQDLIKANVSGFHIDAAGGHCDAVGGKFDAHVHDVGLGLRIEVGDGAVGYRSYVGDAEGGLSPSARVVGQCMASGPRARLYRCSP